MMEGLDDGEIARKAYEWSADFKPFDGGLSPEAYAAYGYEQGYKQAMVDKANSFEDEGYENADPSVFLEVVGIIGTVGLLLWLISLL